MTLPRLYSFRRCPYAMRARMALIISQTPYDLIEVKLSAKPPELLAASPKATVPVLVLADGTIIDESLDIMHWALARNDPENWRASIDETIIAANDGPFKHHLDRYKYPQRHNSDLIEHRASALQILASYPSPPWGGRPGQGGAAGSGNHAANPRHPSFTEIAIFPFIRQFAATDPKWFAAQPLPNLQDWLNHHQTSSLFTTAMAR